MTTTVTCPRCSGTYNTDPHLIRSALSRTDNATAICPPCGTDEAMEDFIEGEPTPQSGWPLDRSWRQA